VQSVGSAQSEDARGEVQWQIESRFSYKGIEGC